MSRQINLLNPSLIKQKDFLKTNNIALLLGVLTLLMLGYFGYAQQQLKTLNQQQANTNNQLLAAQTQLQQITMAHAPKAPSQTLLNQIAQLEKKVTMQQYILQTIQQSSATHEKGYAALMRAFAKQSQDGLWLTSFSFDSATEKLNISGRTLQADLVPTYISGLSTAPVLKGKSFSALTMHLPNNDTNITPKPNTIALEASTGVASSLPAKDVKQSVTPNFIEFSLQSLEEKSVEKTLDSSAPLLAEKKS
jgi:hypothetical protein